MSVGWSSTTLWIAEKYCPRALDFYRSGAPYSREQFQVGIAAHAVLEAIGKESARLDRYLDAEESEVVARGLCETLITTGRSYGGYPEPPMPSAAVWRGRDLAMAYQVNAPLSPKMRYEEGLAVNRDWQLCPYDSGAWLRCLIDAEGTELGGFWGGYEDSDDDVNAAGPVLHVIDYKSAWSAGEDELNSIQRKIQAVLAWLKWGEGHSALKITVLNFRLRREFPKIVDPTTPEGQEVLTRWRGDVESEIAAREAQVGPDGRRPAVPGVGCYGCPYLSQCPEGSAWLTAVVGTDMPESLALSYIIAAARVAELKPYLQAATEIEPIAVDGGLVGTLPKEQRALLPIASESLGAAWNRKSAPRDLESASAQPAGIIEALDIGVEHAEKLLRHLYGKDMDARRREMAKILTTKVSKEFGIHREKTTKKKKRRGH